MEQYKFITLKEMPQLKDKAAEWFQSKWGVPKEAYLDPNVCAVYTDKARKMGNSTNGSC